MNSILFWFQLEEVAEQTSSSKFRSWSKYMAIGSCSIRQWKLMTSTWAQFPWFYSRFRWNCLERKNSCFTVLAFFILGRYMQDFQYDSFILPIPIRHRVRHQAEVRPCKGNLYFYLIIFILLFYSGVQLAVYLINTTIINKEMILSPNYI